MKTKEQIASQLQARELRMVTGSTEANRPLCRDERDRNTGWVAALKWVIDAEPSNRTS